MDAPSLLTPAMAFSEPGRLHFIDSMLGSYLRKTPIAVLVAMTYATSLSAYVVELANKYKQAQFDPDMVATLTVMMEAIEYYIKLAPENSAGYDAQATKERADSAYQALTAEG